MSDDERTGDVAAADSVTAGADEEMLLSSIIGENIIDLYHPARPNDYETFVMAREAERKQQRAEREEAAQREAIELSQRRSCSRSRSPERMPSMSMAPPASANTSFTNSSQPKLDLGESYYTTAAAYHSVTLLALMLML